MRLLSKWVLEFRDFANADLPEYTILSHRWNEQETPCKDFRKRGNIDCARYQKVEKIAELSNPCLSLRQNEIVSICTA